MALVEEKHNLQFNTSGNLQTKNTQLGYKLKNKMNIRQYHNNNI